jgi:vacuolar-type H+-ATPase subunit E/Vma4
MIVSNMEKKLVDIKSDIKKKAEPILEESSSKTSNITAKSHRSGFSDAS